MNDIGDIIVIRDLNAQDLAPTLLHRYNRRQIVTRVWRSGEGEYFLVHEPSG